MKEKQKKMWDKKNNKKEKEKGSEGEVQMLAKVTKLEGTVPT